MTTVAAVSVLATGGTIKMPGSRDDLYICGGTDCRQNEWRHVHRGYYDSWASMAALGKGARSGRGIVYCPDCSVQMLPQFGYQKENAEMWEWKTVEQVKEMLNANPPSPPRSSKGAGGGKGGKGATAEVEQQTIEGLQQTIEGLQQELYNMRREIEDLRALFVELRVRLNAGPDFHEDITRAAEWRCGPGARPADGAAQAGGWPASAVNAAQAGAWAPPAENATQAGSWAPHAENAAQVGAWATPADDATQSGAWSWQGRSSSSHQ